MLCSSIPTQGVPYFYCIFDANFGSLLHGDVSVVCTVTFTFVHDYLQHAFLCEQCMHNIA